MDQKNIILNDIGEPVHPRNDVGFIDDQFLSMAVAYLEIGKAAAGFDTEFKNSYEYQNAVAYQLYHAMELFFKYMINNKIGVIKRIHDLAKLEQEYSELFPGVQYQVEHPLNFTKYESCEFNEDESKLVGDHFIKFKPEFMDQHLRYPTNEKTGGYSFSLEPSVFENVRNRILQVSALGF